MHTVRAKSQNYQNKNGKSSGLRMGVAASDSPLKVSVERTIQENAGGASSKSFAAVLRDLKFRYKVDMVVILEPRVSGNSATKIIKSWGFKYSVRVEAVGFSGGI
ncbi:hypothetical protein K1719_011410 [Acacia pycnantha]|nr:hypothetical protein K1719_011410 [Acacia pycnantha]